MPHSTFYAAPTNATAAQFRAWGRGISESIAAVGFVKAAATGTVNWDTVNAATAVNTAAGYEVWRFDDVLQASTPIFFKLEYGCSSNVAAVQMWITVGRGTDGAGNITGVLVGRTVIGRTGNAVNSTTVTDCYTSSCAQKSCLAVMPFAGTNYTAAASMPGFVLDRSRDENGDPTNEGLTLAIQAGFSIPAQSAAPNTFIAVNYTSAATNTGGVPVIVPYVFSDAPAAAGSALSDSTSVVTFPWMAFAPGLRPWQPVVGQSYVQGDLSPGLVDVFSYGRSRKYRAINVTNHSHWGVGVRAGFDTTGVTVHGFVGMLMIWEDAA